jgi:predicted amidohydrolase
MATATSRTLRIAAWQFAGSGDPERNLAAIDRGLARAKRRKAQLVLFQECALSGYASVDLPSPAAIDRAALAEAERTLRAAVRARGLWAAVGTTAFSGPDGRAQNALTLIGPDGRARGTYAKRAMYGDDARHYAPGSEAGGLHTVEGIRTGLRICYEFRFPEYFRELLAARAALGLVAFSMVGPTPAKRPVARAHLVSRAAENGLWLLSANSVSQAQNAPTCLVDPDGTVVEELPDGREDLLVGTVEIATPAGLRRAIREHARHLMRTGLPAPRG